MPKKGLLRAALLVAAIAASSFAAVSAYAQRERTVQTGEEDGAYGGKFFDQLRGIFGRFRNTDLERAFQGASAISCPELVSNKGEWRPVAFFNENRKLGDWYRATIEEVRADLAVYVFKGVCPGDRSPLQLTTKFPVDESIDAFNAGRISFDRIDINVNPPVSAVYDSRSEAYTFDLPFLFLRERNEGGNIYSLIAPHLTDRYARDVTDHWDCKGVTAEDVTYQFLICRTNLTDRDPALRNQRRGPSFGSSAFFILSDGKEATSSVKLKFGGNGANTDSVEPPPNRTTPEPPPALTPSSRGEPTIPDPPSRRESRLPPLTDGGWRMPDFWSKLVSLDRGGFRLQMSPQTWTGKIGSSQILTDQRMASADAVTPPQTADFCIWKPGSSKSLDQLLNSNADTVDYILSSLPNNSRTPASITFDMKTFTGLQLGSLQCFFPRVDSPDAVSFDRWISIVGAHVSLQVRQ